MLTKNRISIDEYEALRLADYEGHDHESAAAEMEISRPTFSRLIEKARRKMAGMLVDPQELWIDGGNYDFQQELFQCGNCGATTAIVNPADKPVSCPECGSESLVLLNQQFRPCHQRHHGWQRCNCGGK